MGAQEKEQAGRAPASLDDYFGFAFIPLNRKEFLRIQGDLLEKVERALAAMEEDLAGKLPREAALLGAMLKISSWRSLRESLKSSIEHMEEPEMMEKDLYRCAVIFYRDLDHPYWSTEQFQFLLHLNQHIPAYWAGYGTCLVMMQDQGFLEEFRLEEKAAIAFLQAARLALAHLFKKTAHGTAFPPGKLAANAALYYHNACELSPTEDLEQVAALCDELKDNEALQQYEVFSRERLPGLPEGICEELEAALAIQIA
ncbi:MAG: hypothetical protein RDV48_21920 [Candidatus Eremiobacteraeota bacterium]|nr:hypothetical protein [Candidatus Eremiobacteraeota bacterium]